MRISDWSSDVCSSDLDHGWTTADDLTPLLQEIHDQYGKGTDNSVSWSNPPSRNAVYRWVIANQDGSYTGPIGRAACRERVCQYVLISVVAVSLKNKLNTRIKYY